MKNRFCQRRRTFEMVIFAMLAALMFCSKLVMEALPNIHLLGVLTMVCTIVFRTKGLIPIYLYVFLQGLFSGFPVWWLAYLYIWTVLWGITMLVSRRLPEGIKAVIYPIICALHGLCFGILYAPVWALMTHNLSWEGMVASIAFGFEFDLLHLAGNFALGLLVVPLSRTLQKLMKKHG